MNYSIIKFEGDMVYLKYNAPSMEGDTQVHYSKEQKNNQASLTKLRKKQKNHLDKIIIRT